MAPVLPYQSDGTQLVFWAVYAVAFAPDAVRQLREADADAETDHDGGSKRVLVTALAVSVGAAFLVSTLVGATVVRTARLGVFGLGLATTLLGAVLRWYSILMLGEWFHSTVRVRDGHTVVDSGPYRWVRHPSYTGGCLMVVGVGLALTNWLSVALAVVGALLGYGYRIRVEERVLRSELGRAYDRYTERTPYRLVPFVW